MKKAKTILIPVFIILLIFLGLSSVVITHKDEYKLVRQFGKVDHVITNVGISFKIPFIQTADTLPNQTLIYDLPPSDVITADKKTMICDSYILWHIKDPLKFAQTLNSSITGAEQRLDTIVYNATKTVISATRQDDVISGRNGTLSKAIIDSIGNSMEKYGVELLSFETKRLDLPSDNKNAVYERMISERDNIAATYNAEGKSEAQIIRNTTDK
ncbi:MAG: protease modulator HflC, partial [Lachnospiraceae bacterium]|nr:protease modulator HflC [Lachnospiraceae bacterium]